MNPYMIELVIKEKREEMLKEAERRRMISLYDAAQRSNQKKLAVILGDFLIRLGEKLKKRYSSQLELPAS